ncbi:MAG: hypothetical protein J6Q61_04830 [Bacteroidales bacterium]|nr:hypothetical protein [Bacteroidales bacterium]
MYLFPIALGIEAASFFCGDRDEGEGEAEKDIAESPTASPERPNIRLQDYKKIKS